MTRSLWLALFSFMLGMSGTLPLQPMRKTKMTSNTAATDRRQWLASALGTATVVGTASVANADPSILSSVQSPVQDLIAPGHWIGQFVGLNSRQETWNFPMNSPAEVSEALVEVLEELTPERKDKLIIPEFRIQRADAQKVHVLTWTKLEWLDTLDVTFSKSNGGCVAKASFYATGFFPTIVPLAPLLNIGMSWLPFASPGPRGEMLQEFRLRALKGLTTKKLEVVATPVVDSV
uniref:Uncharacterized protein n=1 Tax=Corethron hystrix TaxID=216773 RepID=A0A7S1B8B4_9STRA|mmetsp:Transcript_16735/g.37632  ORF Transcript_16735/g.37632 Transcript_16735/m.37632 type:complete len:234 (+) Transcript_16735:102-803(+)